MDNQELASTPVVPPQKPSGPPPLPKMFSGSQGLTLIVVLLLAVAGWILYAYQWQQSATAPAAGPAKLVYQPTEKNYVGEAVELFPGRVTGSVSLESTLANRRSRREFSDQALSLQQLSQVLWAAQGITDLASGGRTAPSGHSAKAQQQYEPDAAVKAVFQESGHIAENVYLEAEASNLATVVIGGYDPAAVKAELQLPAAETVVYLQPLGNRLEE